jgi:hypothetical protein
MPVLLPRNLAALANIAAKDQGRFAVNALHVLALNGAYRVEATDGRRLAVVRGPCPEENCPALGESSGDAAEVLVPIACWREAFRAKGKKDQAQAVGLAADAAQLRLAVGSKVITGAPAEGKYPPVDNALPKQPALLAIRVDPTLLAGLLLAAAALEPSGGVGLLFYGADKPLGLAARNDAGQFFDGLVMPLT